MRLLLAHPGIAIRDCNHCQEYQYDETTGKPVVRRGELLKRIGNPPCRLIKPDGETGCAKGSPEKPKALTPRNWLAYVHYLECRAVRQFPDDPIVRRNAAVIRMVENSQREADKIQWLRRFAKL